MTNGQPFETNLNGVTWMIQIWLQWYYPKFQALNLEFPEGVVLARILADGPFPNHSTFYFFKVYRTKTDLEWGASVLIRYPWFLDNLFQDFFGVDVSSFCKEKFISCTQQRDLAWEVRSDRVGYERDLEVYHPNFCGRQLGFRQAIPVLFFDSVLCPPVASTPHLKSHFGQAGAA